MHAFVSTVEFKFGGQHVMVNEDDKGSKFFFYYSMLPTAALFSRL